MRLAVYIAALVLLTSGAVAQIPSALYVWAPNEAMAVGRTATTTKFTWNDTRTWSGSTIPVNGDAVDLAAQSPVAATTTPIPPTGTLLSLTASSTGSMTYAMSTIGDCALNATTITGKSNTTGFIVLTGTAPAKTLTITANTIIAGTYPCILLNGLVIVLTGSASINGGFGLNGASCIKIASAGATVTGSGNITGGSGVVDYGIHCTLSGIVNWSNSNIQGGSSVSSGIYTQAGTTTLTNCNFIAGGATGAMPYSGIVPTFTPLSTNYFTFSGTTFGPIPLDHQLIAGANCGPTVGNVVKPATSTVLTGTKYWDPDTAGDTGIYTGATAAQGIFGQTWAINGTSISGIQVVPAITDVRNLTNVGTGQGSLVVPLPGTVVVGTTFDNGTVGTRVDALVAKVLSGYKYGDPDSQLTGIYTGATAAQGVSGYQWGVNGTSISGTQVVPAITDVRNLTNVGTGQGSLVVPLPGTVVVGTTYDGATAGTRVDCPAAKAITTSGNYGNPSGPLVGTNVLPAITDVRAGTAVGVSPIVGTMSPGGYPVAVCIRGMIK